MKARPKDAKFTGANLVKPDLTFAVLSQANLSKADLTLADLSAANLSGANLSRVNLYEANLEGVVLRSIQGRETIRGLNKAKNLDQARLGR